MDPKRKKLYIILIIICAVLSVGILWWGFGGNSSAGPDVSVVPVSTSTAAGPSANKDGTYNPAPVFPSKTTLDTSVLSASKFKALQQYQPTAVTAPEVGRDDPFKNY